MIKNSFIIVILTLLLVGIITPTYAINKSDTSSLTISFITENKTTPMGDVKINIYKLATFSYEDFEVTWNEEYNDYIIDFAFADDDEIISTAAKLSSYVKENNITPDYEITTNSNGEAIVTFENGIYLVCGENTSKNNITYTPNPFMIQMPYTDENGALIYDVSVELKYDRKEPSQPEPTPAPPAQVGQQTTVIPSTTSQTTDYLPLTGDVISIIAGSVILIVVLLNVIIQMIINKRKKQNEEQN